MAANQNYQKAPSAEMLNAAREQQVINARIVALDKALELAKLNGRCEANQLIADAGRIEQYMIGDVDALKPRSAIIRQASMPPQDMFRPGE